MQMNVVQHASTALSHGCLLTLLSDFQAAIWSSQKVGQNFIAGEMAVAIFRIFRSSYVSESAMFLGIPLEISHDNERNELIDSKPWYISRYNTENIL